MCRIYSGQLSAVSFQLIADSRRLKAQKAFTLVELIIVAVLISVMLGAVVIVYNVGFKVFYSQEGRSGMKAEGGKFMEHLSRELRLASSLSGAQSMNITFSLDTDDNGVDETISYSWNGTQGASLYKTITATVPASTLTSRVLNSVSNLSLAYYDANNALLAFPVNASAVRLVAMNMTAVDGDETVFLRSSARLRNF